MPVGKGTPGSWALAQRESQSLEATGMVSERALSEARKLDCRFAVNVWVLRTQSGEAEVIERFAFVPALRVRQCRMVSQQARSACIGCGAPVFDGIIGNCSAVDVLRFLRRLFMRIQSAGILLALASVAFGAHAANLNVNLGSNAASINYAANLTPSGLQGTVGYLHHTDSVDIGNVGLLVTGNSNPTGSPLIFGVGGKLFFISPKQVSGNGTVLGLGGQFNYTWPYYNRFNIGGELYVAPKIVSFNNADRFLEYGVNAGYEILRNAELYVGWRHVSAAFSGTSTVTLDSSFMVGLNLTF